MNMGIKPVYFKNWSFMPIKEEKNVLIEFCYTVFPINFNDIYYVFSDSFWWLLDSLFRCTILLIGGGWFLRDFVSFKSWSPTACS